MKTHKTFRYTFLVCLLYAFFLNVVTIQAQQSFSFVQLCDPQLGFGGYRHDSLTLCQAVRQINEIHPDFVVICGDLVHEPNDTSFSDLRAILSDLAVPYHAAPGNHDVENNPTIESLAYYRSTIGADYFTTECMDHTFVFVNSTLWMAPLEGETEKHDNWLNEVITQLTEEQKPVFIIGHHPLFLKTPEEQDVSNVIPPEKRMQLLSLFSGARVTGYLTGHTHTSVINQYNDMQLVTGETTSLNFDKRPMGFRLWHVTDTSASHEFVPLVMETIQKELEPAEEIKPFKVRR